ncbi:ATP-binding cassette domain-containing protein, partial [Microbacterium sp.]|uniref:ATP-binding cassette domain-containing protein n=1 Tax=Microbacterium sp. TaxID=51671 RepID=UPI003A86D085
PVSGRIRIDGVDLRALTAAERAHAVSAVLHDDHLLDGTIGDNVALGRPEASDGEIAAALSAVGLGGFVDGLPGGIRTRVGPGGRALSGGQRQRVAVARALVEAAPLTLLDEPTSALDADSARLVVAAAAGLAQAGSVVLVSHDLAAVSTADQVVVLDAGRVVQQGSPSELARVPGRFRELLRDDRG